MLTTLLFIPYPILVESEVLSKYSSSEIKIGMEILFNKDSIIDFSNNSSNILESDLIILNEINNKRLFIENINSTKLNLLIIDTGKQFEISFPFLSFCKKIIAIDIVLETHLDINYDKISNKWISKYKHGDKFIVKSDNKIISSIIPFFEIKEIENGNISKELFIESLDGLTILHKGVLGGLYDLIIQQGIKIVK